MQPATITCKNCSNSFTGKFCNECGEKVFSEHDKSVLHLLDEGFHFITHFEGKFFTTLKTIFSRPGQVSVDYCDGIRKRYYKPLSFFLLLVILYLLFPLFQGLNMTIQSHMNYSAYNGFARRTVAQVMESKQMNLTDLNEKFLVVSSKVSKVLLFLIIPFGAIFFQLFLYRKRKHFYDHLIFSTEINAFYILWGYLLLPLLLRGIYLLFKLIGIQQVLAFIDDDGTIGIIALSVFAIFLVPAIRMFYGLPWLLSTLMAVVYVAALVFFIEMVYKFLLFVISINLV